LFIAKRETITQWESGARDLKTEYTIKLADYFGVTCDYILRGVKAENVDINKRLGLSDEAIEEIEDLKSNDNLIAILNNLIIDYRFSNVINYIEDIYGAAFEVQKWYLEAPQKQGLLNLIDKLRVGYEVEKLENGSCLKMLDLEDYIELMKYKISNCFLDIVAEMLPSIDY